MNQSVIQRFQLLATACSDPRNNSKDDLREQTRSFVSSFFRQAASDTTASSSSIKPDELLAALLQSLAPALTTSHAARVCALSTVAGALQACQNDDAISISGGLLALLGRFLLTHAKPLEHEDDMDDGDDEELVRDTALIALACLLRTRILSATVVMDDDDDAATGGDISVVQKIMLAKHGVENRVAFSEDLDENDYHSAMDRERGTINGLSLLPRSRRSLCFDLLQACVDGISKMDPNLSSSSQLVDFVLFVCNCLHGESDPRCLLQLLRLLQKLLTVFAPFFNQVTKPFPIGDVFDAIAPYYPVQFTPPPNNPHGITKEGLQEALRSVMCCTLYDAQATVNGSDIMLSLSLAIILEQLVPLPGDEPTTMTEKLAALEDLEFLLFPPNVSQVKSAFLELDATALGSISQAMIAVHQEASLAVASTLSSAISGTSIARCTADKCRSMVAKLALECERDTATWDAFVGETIKSMSETIMSAPSNQLSIAYMANLCGCGGLKTMEACLRQGLQPLLKVLEDSAQGLVSDNAATVIYGIGAFFAATKTTIYMTTKAGVVVTPHPLADDSAAVASRLAAIAMTASFGDNESLVIATAAIRAYESVLLASPAACWTHAQATEACEFLNDISTPLLVSGRPTNAESKPAYEEYLVGCCKTIGSLLGRCGEDSGLLSLDGAVSLYLQQELLPLIVSSAKSACTVGTRYDWLVISFAACSRHEPSVAKLVEEIARALRGCVLSDNFKEAVTCTQALSVAFRLGGSPVIRAFHKLRSPSITAGDVLDALAGTSQSSGVISEQLSSGISLLNLPPTEDESDQAANTLDSRFQLVSLLRTAWTEIPLNEVDGLLSQLSEALPPLNNTDMGRITVIAPILSASLSALPKRRPPFLDEERIKRLLPDLAEFALRSEHHAGARFHATLCIKLLVGYHLSQAEGCPAAALANDFIMPSLQRAAQVVNYNQGIRKVSILRESATLLAALCGAAACRGGVSYKTADLFVVFLVDLACSGDARLSLGGERELHLKFREWEIDPAGSATGLSLDFASHVGSIFSNDGNNNLWKQRLTSVAMKRIQSKWNALSEVVVPSGMVATVCYIVCASNATTLGQSTLQLCADIVARALSPLAQSCETSPQQITTLKKLVLGTLLKLLSIAPSLLSQTAPYMTTGVLRAYVSGTSASPSADVACKLLALQALESLIRMENGDEILARTKPAVLAVLTSAMNHPSSVLRNAAVEVRNVWALD